MRVTITIECTVYDPQALWDKAHAYMIEGGLIDGSGDAELIAMNIGTREAPNVGGCLQMLLDRSEFLDGADIEQSSSDADDFVEDDDDGSYQDYG
jgi:hypothetical protein